MAGHRADTGKPRRCDSRAAGWRERVASEPTGERQLSTAFDYLRAVAHRHPDRQAELHRLATMLTREAAALERGLAA